MRVLIVYYSRSGHTARLAQVLTEAMRARGHAVITEAIAVKREWNKWLLPIPLLPLLPFLPIYLVSASFRRLWHRLYFQPTQAIHALVNIDLAGFDLILLGTPKWLYISYPIARWLDRVRGLAGKRVASFATFCGPPLRVFEIAMLFEPEVPDGFAYRERFIAEEEEATLARDIASLEFDFTSADQYRALGPLKASGMRATFYVNSGLVGRPGRMTWKQLRHLQALGHEIGGNTLTHARLTDLTLKEATREVCEDRRRLLDHGLAADAFAYPFGAYDARLIRLVERCGYTSARLASGITSPGKVCISCPYAETIPPRNPFATRMPAAVQGSRIAPVFDAVARAQEAGGGWVQLLMHRVCRRCNRYAISIRSLRQLLGWLDERADLDVLTVSQVTDVGGPRVSVVPPAGTPRAGRRVTFRVGFESARGVESIRYFVDDRLVRIRNYGPWRLNYWLPGDMKPGEHTLAALLEDRDGNVALSAQETFVTR